MHLHFEEVMLKLKAIFIETRITASTHILCLGNTELILRKEWRNMGGEEKD